MRVAEVCILARMARHRAPDVVSPLHGVHPTGTGRPRHAAAAAARVHAPDHRGRHRGPASPSERRRNHVADRQSPCEADAGVRRAVGRRGAPAGTAARPRRGRCRPRSWSCSPAAPTAARSRRSPTATAPAPADGARPSPGPGSPAWCSCAVVAGGQGPREEGLWILGVGGGALTTVGLGLLLLRRLATADGTAPQ